jgi:pre-rRNA-processing protein IPI3
VSSGDDGGVAVFPLIRFLDIDDADGAWARDLAIYCVAAHVAPVTCVVCGHGGYNAAVASASVEGTCKV